MFILFVLLGLGCSPKVVEEDREPCSETFPQRTALYGDLHAHTALSFDAGGYALQLRVADALAFAQGESVLLPPYDENGVGTRAAQLERPLDFVGITEHGELLGEVSLCTDPTSSGYSSDSCENYRSGNGALVFGTFMASTAPKRAEDLCGPDGQVCLEHAAKRWSEMRQAAEAAYDRTSACTFTAFPSYEYTNSMSVTNLHRNVIFKNDIVPERPVTFYEAPTPDSLWTQLAEQCKDAGTGCDVVVIPHNSNLSNGQLFTPLVSQNLEYDRQTSSLRARMEPLVEVFQHKGDSECRNGFDDVIADVDPLCSFEKLRPVGDTQCGDEVGTGGMRLWGCSHRLDFVRNVLKEGLAEEARLGSNPYRLGFIGSTDTHSGMPGYVDSVDFLGHVATADDTVEERLGEGTITHDAVIYNPGGLAAVWATENTRTAIFDALQRRETFATSGPRIPVRLFAADAYDADLCDQIDWLQVADKGGVPMGGTVEKSKTSPTFLAWAAQDEGTTSKPGTPLQRLQIVKGWRETDGTLREKVFEVAGDPNNGATVDTNTCEASGAGAKTLCAVWQDPDFNAEQSAFYYVRAIENPTCRWSTRQCLEVEAATPEAVPPSCSDASIAKTVQQRAWSSPIWLSP